jgi:ketosteroid isomerase-like protein
MGAAVAEYIRDLRDLRIVAERLVALDYRRVLVLCRHRAVAPASGVPYDKEIGDILTLRDGQIVDWKTYWNPDEALEAAGLSE